METLAPSETLASCRQCSQPITQAYCADCGQPTQLKRIDGRYVMNEIRGLLLVEKDLLFTVKQLIFHPGKSIRIFLKECRHRLIKPLLV